MTKGLASFDSQRVLWDVIVIGTGPGGSTAGFALSAPGRRVLFLEKGRDLRRGEALRGRFVEDFPCYLAMSDQAREQHLSRGGRATESFVDLVRGDRFVPQIGCGTGGSSVLWGMTMERLFPSDFERDWPVSYAQMEPWYERAERMFHVRGTQDPLRAEAAAHLLPPPPLAPATQAVFDAASEQGLHPYRLHLACERVPACTLCHGHLCGADGGCKYDALRVCLAPALTHEGNYLLCQTEVTALESGGCRIARVHARQPDGTALRFQGRVVVLAAGALTTPRILLDSGLAGPSGLTGRRLMRHAIDLYVLRGAPRVPDHAASKELGLNDFYETRDALGSIQSFGLPPPVRYLLGQPGFNVWRAMGPLAAPVAAFFARTPIIASIVEDAPDPENGLARGPAGWQVSYRLNPRDHARRQTMRALVMRTFRRFGPVRGGGTDDRKALGHVCGTCRFGADPRTSVLDADNRVHGLDNLYVTDASCFPTSGAVSPGLTIIANALRASEQIGQRL